jgi:hypothetical protein
MGEILKEIQGITSEQCVKKQDKARMNFPALIEKIKSAANNGDSSIIISTYEMNEFDKKLLEDEGFKVYLIDRPRSRYDGLLQYDPSDNKKSWEIKW